MKSTKNETKVDAYKKLISSPNIVPAATMANPSSNPHTRPTRMAIISWPNSCDGTNQSGLNTLLYEP